MKVIWKFYLVPGCSNQMPKGAVVTAVGPQGDDVCLWAMVDPRAPMEERWFSQYGTGQPIVESDNLKYVGSCQWERNEGNRPTEWAVMHVFEDLKP